MALVISLNRYRQDGFSEPFVANVQTLGQLNVVLQTHLQSPSGIQVDALRTQILPLLTPIEDAGLLPTQMAKLRAFAEAESGTGPSTQEIQEIAARVAQVHGVLQQADGSSFQLGDPSKSLGHLTARRSIQLSIIPLPLSDSELSAGAQGLGALFQVGQLFKKLLQGEMTVNQVRGHVVKLLPVIIMSGALPQHINDIKKFCQGSSINPDILRGIVSRIEVLETAHRAVDSEDISDLLQRDWKKQLGIAALSSSPLSLRYGGATSIAPPRSDLLESKAFCPACNLPNEISENYCQNCGSALRPERRDVTILFLDIKGFSAMSEGMDPIELMDFLGNLFEALGGEVTFQGGRENKFLGDSLMAVFGAPKSQPDHAVRAVRAALAMQRRMTEINQLRVADGKSPVLIRIGINTGEVAAGYLHGKKMRHYDVVGNAVNIASRLEGQAEPGGILISDAVLASLGGLFEVDDRGKITVKNITEPIRVYQVTGDLSDNDFFETQGVTEIDFVGRQKELAMLQQAYHEASLGRKSNVLVVGNPGYGKSRLRTEFVRWLQDIANKGTDERNAVVLLGKGVDLPEIPPYHVMSKALRQMLWNSAGIKPTDTQEDIEEKLRSHVRHLFGEQSDEKAEFSTQLLADFVGHPFSKELPSVEAIFKNAAELRMSRYEVVARYFESLTSRQPVVVIMEDIHWADAGTLDLMATLTDRLTAKPFMVAGFARPEFLEQKSFVAATIFQPPIVELRGLSNEILKTIADRILRDDISLVAREFIIAQSTGNPFILQQMARALNDGWTIANDPLKQMPQFIAPSGRLVPFRIKDFFQARIDQLSGDERGLLDIAAVLSRDFDLQTLEALGIEDARSILDSLIEKEFSVALGKDRFEFRHAILRETVHHMMDDSKRRDHHLAAANYYMRKDGERELAVIAYHLEQADQKYQAAIYYYEAAKEAFEQGVPNTAVSFERAYNLSNDTNFKFRILRSWYEAAIQDKDYDEHDKIHNLGLAMLQAANNVDPMDRAGVSYRLGRTQNRRSRFRQAESELMKAWVLIERLQETPAILGFKASIRGELGFNYGETGQLAKSLTMFQESYDLAVRTGDSFHIARGLWGINEAANKHGRFSGIFPRTREVYKIFRRRRDYRRASASLTEWARTCMLLGDYERAEKRLVRASEILKGKANEMGNIYSTLGRVIYLQGRRREGIKYLEDYMRQNPDHDNLLKNEVYLALGYSDLGQAAEAEDMATKISKLAAEKMNYEYEAVAQMILAKASLQQGDVDAAIQLSTASIKTVEMGYVSSEFDLVLMLSHTKVLLESGRNDEAWRHLDHAQAVVKNRSINIDNVEHIEMYRSRVAENREISRLWQVERALQKVEAKDHDDVRIYTDKFVHTLSFDSPPNELRSIINDAVAGAGTVVAQEDHEIIHESQKHEAAASAAVLVDIPLASVLATLLTTELRVADNPGEIEQFRAENISFKMVRTEDLGLYGIVDWKIGSPLTSGKVVLAFYRRGEKREILQASIENNGSSVMICLRRAPLSRIVSKDGLVYEAASSEDKGKKAKKKRARPRASEFGTLQFSLVPTSNDQTVVVLSMGKALYTRNPWNFLIAFAQVIKSKQ